MMEILAADARLSDPEVTLLSHILNGAWGAFFRTAPDQLRARLGTGHLFAVARDRATPEERDYVSQTYKLFPAGEVIPVALLETIDAVTAGDPSRVPSPYAALTADGAWRPPLAAADTLVFVDLTTATSRQRSGAGRLLVEFALAHRAPHHRFVYTFTPNVPEIVAWHVRRGARASGAVLPGARPGHAQPDVTVMDYSHS